VAEGSAAVAEVLAAVDHRGVGEMLSEQDKARISAAITEVEATTAGEVFCVLAKDVSRYREVPLLWAAIAAFVVPPVLVVLGLHRLALAPVFTSWTDGSAHGTEGLILRALYESNGDAHAVSEDTIRAATLELSRASGVDAAPEGGCALAVTRELVAAGRIPKNAEVLVFNTGSGASYRS